MKVYEKIRLLCKERNVTITGLEKELGFARGSLCKIDKNKPSAEKLQKLADYFDVPIETFINPVQTSGQKKEYYEDATLIEAQALFDDPDIHALMDAAKGCRPEYIKSAVQLLKTLKETNPDG